MAKKLRIISKTDGFRRCGIAHPAEATHYDLDRFSEAEIKALKDEPNLIIDEVDVKDVKEKPADKGESDKK